MVLVMFNSYNKYKNIKTKTSDGIKHDSRKEASRWIELNLLAMAGDITDLERQKKYVLIPAQYESYERYSKKGKRLKDGVRLVEREVTYIADFVYKDKDGKVIVEDTKSDGTRTKEYKIKRKLMLFMWGIRVKEI